MTKRPRGRHGFWDKEDDAFDDSFLFIEYPGSLEQARQEIVINCGAVRASASLLSGIAEEIEDVSAKVGEGYANPASFGSSTKAKRVAKDWNDAVDARQSEIKDFALRVNKIANALVQIAGAWEERDQENSRRFDRIPLGVTDEERATIRGQVRGRDQESDRDDGDGAGGDQDGGTGD